MPRIRTIKPEITQDLKLASVSRDARYTFVLLITQADDEGLIPGAHRQLLGLLYPHDEDVTAAKLIGWVEELVTIGVVQWRATVDGAPILELTNWSKHQRVDNKAKSHLAASLLPVEETPAEIAAARGGSRRTAESRGLDLGPRTKDQGGADALAGIKAAAEDVFAFYLSVHPNNRPDKRSSLKLITTRLATYTADELKAAIRGNAADSWAISSGNQQLSYVLKSNDAIDKWRNRAAPAIAVIRPAKPSRGVVLLDLCRRYDLFSYNANQEEYEAKLVRASEDPQAGPEFRAECRAFKPWKGVSGDNDHFKVLEIEKRLGVAQAVAS